MTSRPILFSGPMVLALLEGRKTQTRRVVKLSRSDAKHTDIEQAQAMFDMGALRCLYGQPGDLLWVRETWSEVGNSDPGHLVYKATYPNDLPPDIQNVPADIHEAGYRWRPSIHMPRWASRLTLRITDVRVQRLQEISEEDAKAEGVHPEGVETGRVLGEGQVEEVGSYVLPYSFLWDSINGVGSWKSNPWVWAITFGVIKANVDQCVMEP